MSRIWINGRLAWPPVALVVFTTVLVLAFDFSWRLITAPFWMFATATIIAWLIGVAIIVMLARRFGRPRRRDDLGMHRLRGQESL
jgi:hypothetical protein